MARAALYPFFIPRQGCPHDCIFCRQELSVGGEPAPSPDRVGERLATVLPERGEGEVAFYGGSFSLLTPELQRRYLDAVAPFIDAGRARGVRVSTRPDGLDDARIDLLRRGGVTTVEIGCQSFDSEVLRRSGRGHGTWEIAEAVIRLRRREMGVGLQLMPGLPGGDEAEALASLEAALALAPDFLRIYPLVVLRGTSLERLVESGGYSPWSLERAVVLCARMWRRCRRARVPVIRWGLQGTTGLDSGADLVAGPYHPAFGQLVRSRIWRDALAAALAGSPTGELRVHPADLSDALGHRRANYTYLGRRFGTLTMRTDARLSRQTFNCAGRVFALAQAVIKS